MMYHLNMNYNKNLYKKIASKILEVANTVAASSKKGSSNFVVMGGDSSRWYARSVIIDSMQQGVISPFFDERLLYPDKEWRNELSKQDVKYIKDTLFDILFEKPFDEYARGIQSSEEKIDLVHSKLRSMYREQKEFIDSLNNDKPTIHS